MALLELFSVCSEFIFYCNDFFSSGMGCLRTRMRLLVHAVITTLKTLYLSTVLSCAIWFQLWNEAIARADSYSSSRSTNRFSFKGTPCPLYYFCWVGGPGLLGESYSNDSLLRCRQEKKVIHLFSQPLILLPLFCPWLTCGIAMACTWPTSGKQERSPFNCHSMRYPGMSKVLQ